MTKEQATALIAAYNSKVKAADKRRSDLRSLAYNHAQEEIRKATKAIQAKMEDRYKLPIERANAAHLKALNQWKSARIKYAADLIGIPVTTVMGEWDNSWGDWKPTGRTGRLEVYMEGADWNKQAYPRPEVGTVIIRIVGTSGRMTKEACLLSYAVRDSSFRKRCWLPVGERPK